MYDQGLSVSETFMSLSISLGSPCKLLSLVALISLLFCLIDDSY